MNGDSYSQDLVVELAAGGELPMQTGAEVDRWNTLMESYRNDYGLVKINDLSSLDQIVQQQIIIFRAQQALNGLTPQVDDEGLPTGNMKFEQLKPAEQSKQQDIILSAQKELRALEKALGIDKASRDAGGRDTIESYLSTLRAAGREYGIHVSDRVKKYEQFVNELAWRLRLNQQGDDEDKRYHQVTDEALLEWCRDEHEKLVEFDKAFARDKQALWVGRL